MLSHEGTNLKIEDKLDIEEITVFYKTSTMRTEPTAPSCNNYTRKPEVPELGNILTHASDYYCHLFIHTEEKERIKCRKQFLVMFFRILTYSHAMLCHLNSLCQCILYFFQYA